MTDSASPAVVLESFQQLQDEICAAFEGLDSSTRFDRRVLDGERGGQSRPRVLADGNVLEKAAVHLSHAIGPSLPPSATASRPDLQGRPFEAVSLSLITHPRNPYAPTSHMNIRFFFLAEADDAPLASAEVPPGSTDGQRPALWWFGGGFDLTPYYGFEEDARHWHRSARAACLPHGQHLYPRFKDWCDRYFYLPHRDEPRGIGGLFFDDLSGDDLSDIDARAEDAGNPLQPEPGSRDSFEQIFAFVKDVGRHYLLAYLPILERRADTPYTDREVDFQLYRRGRYAEFNLLYDRGTKHGLQAKGRTESILASMPPRALWRYDWQPEPGTPEAKLYTDFLRPRNWADD